MGRRVWIVILLAAVVVVAVTGVYIGITLTPPGATSLPLPPGDNGNGNGGEPPLPPPPEQSDCPRSKGICVDREVTGVIDGDTLDVEGGLRIRLVLVDAPELGESGGPAARDFLTDICQGSLALIDEDDFQIGDDPFGRILAVVHCDGRNANAALISSGHARTFYAYCDASEFGDEAWTGCASRPPQEDCDPSYPDFCIPPPPPDLDCADIPHTDFTVLPPDPHGFDGDGDGVGCET